MNLRPIGSNMTELDTGKAIVLFSYGTPVAAKVKGQLYRTVEAYSKTTTSHINKWLERRQAGLKPQSFFDALVKGDVPEPGAPDAPPTPEAPRDIWERKFP